MIRKCVSVESQNGFITISEFSQSYWVMISNPRRTEGLWVSGEELEEILNQIKVLLDKSR